MLLALRKVSSLMDKNVISRQKHEICLCEMQSVMILENNTSCSVLKLMLKQLRVQGFLAMLTTSTLPTEKNDRQLFRQHKHG